MGRKQGGRARRTMALAATVILGTAGLSATVGPAASADVPPPSGAGYAWGDNYYRQLGDGNPLGTSIGSPTPPAGLGTGVTRLEAYGYGTFALKDGAWQVWGYGANGELCNGSAFTTAFAPTASSISGTATVAGGGFHEVLLDGGAASACGDGGSGELGNGGNTNSSSPVPVQGLGSGVVSVGAGNVHSLAVLSDSSVVAWGSNSAGQLGNGTTDPSNTPVPVTGLSGVQAVAGGYEDSLALKTDGTVVGWGRNAEGELGDGTTTERDTPVPVSGLTDVIEITESNYWSMALKSDGTVWTWGGNFAGMLGNGTMNDVHVPQQVAGLPFITQIAAGANHAAVLSSSGAVYTWGGNNAQQLGNSGSAAQSLVPTVVSGVSATQVVAGQYHTAALLPDGSVRSWGDNSMGQVGTGATPRSEERRSPGPIVAPGDAHLVAIDGGSTDAVALTDSGGVLAWGENTYGELGNGTTSEGSGTPVPVVGLSSGVKQVAAAGYQSFALKDDGSLVSWGANFGGELGDGTTTNRSTPVAVVGLGGPVATIASGNSHTVAAMADGTVRAWGSNYRGHLGDGTTNPSATPVQPAGLTDIVAVGAGDANTYAVNAVGDLYAWGDNNYGQLGNGTTSADPTTTPQLVSALSGVHIVSVQGGWGWVAAVDSDGQLWTWGVNADGQLGDGTRNGPRTTPALVALPHSVSAIAVGGLHMLALLDDGSVYAWGFGGSGQLGNGGATPIVETPAPVSGLPASGALAVGAGGYYSFAIAAVPDTTSPAVTLDAPADDSVVLQGEVIDASYWCTDDGGSGIDTCDGPVASGDAIDTGTLGAHTFAVIATDHAGNETTVTHAYTVVPYGTYTIDPGAVFTPIVPTSSAPVTTLPPESLSGSFHLDPNPDPQQPASHPFTVNALHLVTGSGATFDLTSNTSGSLTCWDTDPGCYPDIPLTIQGLPGTTQGSLETTGIAIVVPNWEGSPTDPTGFDGAQPNVFVPPGVSVYRQGPHSLEIIGVFTFHATRVGFTGPPPDITAPDVTLDSPGDGSSYSLGDTVNADYSCTDDGGSGLATCDGPAASGTPIDTTTAGLHTFTVNATDGAGNASLASATYRVLAGDVSATVAGGEVITTDPGGVGASPAVPIQTEIAVPVGVSGQITVTPQPSGSPPVGYSLFSRQLVLSGPAASGPTAPYRVTFTVDASELGGLPPSAIDVFRNGIALAPCTGSNDAAPDPCLESRNAAPDSSGDALVTVRTTQFSTWTLGQRLFSVLGASPSSRAQGASHQSVTVTGSGFLSGATVKASGSGITVNSTTFSSSTSLTVDLSVSGSAATGARNMTVTNVGGATATCTGCFTVNAKPTIGSASPSSRPQGAAHQAITLSGSGFQTGASVVLSGTGITVHSVSFVDSGHLALDLSVAPNAATGARSATVTNPDAGTVTKTSVFTVNAAPTFTGVTKSTLRQGQTVTVTLAGTGFAASFVTAGGTVSFGPDVAVGSVVRNSATKLTATLTVSPSAALGVRSATIVNPDGGSATCSGCVTVVADPTITSLVPSSRARGTSHQAVVVSGTGFQTGATVKVSGSGVTINSATWNSTTQLTLDVSVGSSATLGTRDLTVTNPDGGIGICVGCFTVNAKPVLTSVTPSSRPRGSSHQTVTLAGSGFQSGLAVSISGTGVTVAVVTVTATSATLDVSVAANAATGNRTVTVTNPDGGTVSKSNAFKVT